MQLVSFKRQFFGKYFVSDITLCKLSNLATKQHFDGYTSAGYIINMEFLYLLPSIAQPNLATSIAFHTEAICGNYRLTWFLFAKADGLNEVTEMENRWIPCLICRYFPTSIYSSFTVVELRIPFFIFWFQIVVILSCIISRLQCCSLNIQSATNLQGCCLVYHFYALWFS